MSRARKPSTRLSSIIIPCWNGLRYTKDCLAALRRCTSLPHEIIVVDNGSTDGTAPFLRRAARLRGVQTIRNQANRGFGAAINQGMKRAKGDYLVWLNNDAVVTPGWLEKLAACAERFPNAAAVGPLVNREPTGGETGRPDPDKTAAAMALRAPHQAAWTPWLSGFCLLLKKEAVERVGLLDPRFRFGYEDYDYGLRLRQAGYDLLIAQDAYVHHHWHKSFARPSDARKTFAAARRLFIEKWCRRTLEFLTELPPLQHRGSPLWTQPVRKGVHWERV